MTIPKVAAAAGDRAADIGYFDWTGSMAEIEKYIGDDLEGDLVAESYCEDALMDRRGSLALNGWDFRFEKAFVFRASYLFFSVSLSQVRCRHYLLYSAKVILGMIVVFLREVVPVSSAWSAVLACDTHYCCTPSKAAVNAAACNGEWL